MPHTNQSTIQNGIDAAIVELEQMLKRSDLENYSHIDSVIAYLKNEEVRKNYGHYYHMRIEYHMFRTIDNKNLRAAINNILDKNIKPYLPSHAYKRNAGLFFGAIGLLVGATITSALLTLFLPSIPIMVPLLYLLCASMAYVANYQKVAALLIAPLYVAPAICTAIGVGIGGIVGTIAGSIAQLCTRKDAPVIKNTSHEPTQSSTRAVGNTLSNGRESNQVVSVSEHRYQRLAPVASAGVSNQAPAPAPLNDSTLTSIRLRPGQ